MIYKNMKKYSIKIQIVQKKICFVLKLKQYECKITYPTSCERKNTKHLKNEEI